MPQPDMAELFPDETGSDCLLVVDEQEANIQVLGAMLGKVGFEILPAANVAQALQHLETRQPDLILLDLRMPGLDGLELCRRIQEHTVWADIPIIFLSAADDKNLIVRALESGGVDYITKPFNKLELVSRVRTHLMLKTARDHLKRIVQDKEELLGIISHYLQNHFAGIEMSSQVLLNRISENDDSTLRLLAEIRNASGRMRAFVKSFLANSAADHKLTIKAESVVLADAAAQVARQYEAAAQAKGIGLRTVFPEENTSIWADSMALMQVLDNLISNAVKFSPSGSEVFVEVQPGNTRMECRVRDQGAGFTKEDKAAMYGRYARLSARPTGGEPSTGLGLSIARKLTQAMGGELVCESEPGQGATFILRFPAVNAVSPDSSYGLSGN
jgi:two-component system, sensor histidine kinase and response regulator